MVAENMMDISGRLQHAPPPLPPPKAVAGEGEGGKAKAKAKAKPKPKVKTNLDTARTWAKNLQTDIFKAKETKTKLSTVRHSAPPCCSHG
eukprot:6932456-Karenia_brevis.AAC.1